MNNWKKCLIKIEDTIQKAIEIVDATEAKIAIVVDSEMNLLGTVTDYDIRQHILQGKALNFPVDDIMNINPKFSYYTNDNSQLLNDMIAKGVRQLPLVDCEKKIVGLSILSDFKKEKKKNRVLLMAGGLGMRLRPLTENCPKPLLRIGEKPILQIIMEGFIKEGFLDFYISVNYKSEMIEDYFGNGERFGVNISYIHESKRLGTAGALGLISDELNEPVIVMNGDLLTNVNFSQLLTFHTNNNSVATMCGREYKMQVPFGVINYDNWEIKSLKEKPIITNFVNAGIYVLNPDVIKAVKKDEYLDMPDLFTKLINENKKTLVFPLRESWLDIGRLEDFERARREFI